MIVELIVVTYVARVFGIRILGVQCRRCRAVTYGTLKVHFLTMLRQAKFAQVMATGQQKWTKILCQMENK